jgi:hypothetical protein
VSDLFAGGERAHARRTDPETSHKAADAVTPGLNAIQQQVERYARTRIAGFLDVDLVDAIPDLGPSTLRTRRAELVARNIVLDSGRTSIPEGATTPHTVWIHRDFVAGAPPICEPPTLREPISPDDIAEARKLIEPLLGAAKMSRAYGLTGCVAIAERAADLLRRLSA